MAWMSDEEYMFMTDCRDKKSTAASAFKRKTHAGKGGRVKLPTDFRSKKEIESMNGECKHYRMNEPITWSEFIEWPNEHKITYINRLREKFGVSDQHVAEMFGVATNIFLMYIKELNLDTKIKCDADWDHERFHAWLSGTKTEQVEGIVGPDLIKPMKWDEFKTLSDEQKIAYILGIRERFGAPDGYIADMLGTGRNNFAKNTIHKLGIGLGKGSGNGKKKWDKDSFEAWARIWKTVKAEEVVAEEDITMVEKDNDIPEVIIEESDAVYDRNCECETKTVVPKTGTLSFDGNVDDILRTIRMLLGDSVVHFDVSWTVIDE